MTKLHTSESNKLRRYAKEKCWRLRHKLGKTQKDHDAEINAVVRNSLEAEKETRKSAREWVDHFIESDAQTNGVRRPAYSVQFCAINSSLRELLKDARNWSDEDRANAADRLMEALEGTGQVSVAAITRQKGEIARVLSETIGELEAMDWPAPEKKGDRVLERVVKATGRRIAGLLGVSTTSHRDLSGDLVADVQNTRPEHIPFFALGETDLLINDALKHLGLNKHGDYEALRHMYDPSRKLYTMNPRIVEEMGLARRTPEIQEMVTIMNTKLNSISDRAERARIKERKAEIRNGLHRAAAERTRTFQDEGGRALLARFAVWARSHAAVLVLALVLLAISLLGGGWSSVSEPSCAGAVPGPEAGCSCCCVLAGPAASARAVAGPLGGWSSVSEPSRAGAVRGPGDGCSCRCVPAGPAVSARASHGIRVIDDPEQLAAAPAVGDNGLPLVQAVVVALSNPAPRGESHGI